MSRSYNIQDIARAAGVSRGTVSRVLNESPAVSDETRKRVLDVIEKLDYLPSFSARHMRTNNSNLVGFGLLTDEVITTPYAVDMIRGAQETLWAQGKVMLVINAGYASAMTEASLEALLERRVEGILYATEFHRPVVLPEKMSQVPVVLANCYAVNRKYPSVVPDEVGGGYTATKTLLQKGHRRIAFINLSAPRPEFSPIPAGVGRLEGYKRALAEYDVPFDESLLRYTDGKSQTLYRYVREFVYSPNPPTAIFCGYDRAAMGVYGGLAALGLHIPDDMAVIGFDNQRDIAEGLWPSLTTIQLPHYAMGKWAVDYLMSEHTPQEEPVQKIMECPLVERESV